VERAEAVQRVENDNLNCAVRVPGFELSLASNERYVRGGLTRRRSWRGPASARRPSRLGQRSLRGVTPPASRASNAGKRRAALP
jgi:hypothetical protein